MDEASYYKHVRAEYRTVAIYGNRGPYLFHGHLTCKQYYKDSDCTQIDPVKTSVYLLDTLYYETNKVLRMQNREEYDEVRQLNALSYILLSDPFRLVYNQNALPALQEDNLIDLLSSKDPNARGTAIVMKEEEDGSLSPLTEEEADLVMKSLGSMM